MKAGELTVEVKAKLSVDRRTAEGCLKLVELYVNESGENIIGERAENGELSFRFTENGRRHMTETIRIP